MRFNKYARHYTLDDLHILFNMLNDVIIVVAGDVFETIDQLTTTPIKIKDVHPDFFASLVNNGFLVDQSFDETSRLIESWRKEDLNPSDVKLTINPTLQCNLRCWYCYENHAGTSRMTSATLSAIRNLIDKKLDNPSLHKFILDFFGGEPLLYFDSCMKPLIAHTVRVANEKAKKIGIAMTTNGTLLTSKICDILQTVPGPVSLQITLDGDRECHNQIRFFESGKGTFDIIVANIKLALSYGFHVSVRYNYTSNNYRTYQDLLTEFENISDECKRRLNFSFHKVWQDIESDEVERHILDTKSRYSSKGFSVNLPNALGTGLCYADRSQNLVVNYNGLVYRCTARDFTPENAEGQLLIDGSILWNERFFHREKIKYGSEVCQRCVIFPICHNGCSQDKLEQYPHIESCPRGYCDAYKEMLAKTRTAQLLQLTTAKNNYTITNN